MEPDRARRCATSQATSDPMSRFLALPVAFTATIGASIKRIHDAKTARQRAHARAKQAEYCREICYTRRVNRCDCE